MKAESQKDMVAERLRYLLKAILKVDVDKIAKQTVASISVERALEALKNSQVWQEYMEKGGALILFPDTILQMGKK